jgi:Ricin-type beta-trefoil lectin domain
MTVLRPPFPTAPPTPDRASPVRTRSLVSFASGRCIDVPGGQPRDGTRLWILDCDGSPSQRWTFEPDGTLRSMGMCMDVAWGSSDNGAVIQLVRCHGGPAQEFHHNNAGDLVNVGADKCVDVQDMRTENGTPLQLWQCAGTANQKWSAV